MASVTETKYEMVFGVKLDRYDVNCLLRDAGVGGGPYKVDLSGAEVETVTRDDKVLWVSATFDGAPVLMGESKTVDLEDGIRTNDIPEASAIKTKLSLVNAEIESEEGHPVRAVFTGPPALEVEWKE